MTDRDAILERLRDVTDPDLGGDVVTGGLVTDLTVADGEVTLSVELTGFAPETAEELVEQMRAAVFELPGVERVRVEESTPDAAGSGAGAADPADGAPASGGPSPSDGPHGAAGGDAERASIDADRVIAVASAKGGVGKSTVAASLARGLAEQGEDVGLFDADIHGPNLPELLDAEGPVVATDEGRAAPVAAAGLEVMSIGLLDNDAPIAWRGAMAHEALLDLLTDTAWGDLDTLVLDLPPGTGDIVLTTLQDVPVDGVLLVTTPYPTAVDDTGRSATLFRENGIPIAGAVVNMAGFTCPTCGDDHALFDHEEAPGDALDVPVLAELPFDERLRDPASSLPPEMETLADRVGDRIDEVGFDLPENPLDVSGLPPNIRAELVADEFAALDGDESVHVLTDRNPDSLLAALGADEARDDQPGSAHEGCQCGHDASTRGKETESGLDAVGGATVRQVGPDEWALRLQKAPDSDTATGEAADAD